MSRVTDQPWALVALAGAIVVGAWLLRRVPAAVGNAAAGIVTGNNIATQTATNAAGTPTTAYQGAGIVGTVGATVNHASGGVLASIGEWIGSTVYDLTHSAAPAAAPAAGAGQGTGATQPSGWDYSSTGQGLSWEQASAPDGWWPYGVRP